MSQPDQSHWKAVKLVSSCIKGGLNFGLIFESSLQKAVEFAGADCGGDIFERTSASGCVFHAYHNGWVHFLATL